MMNKLIELKNLTKNFDDQQVLRGINLDIYEKEFLTLLGPSGCGKTTTLRIIAGFEEPSDGEVLFNGIEISKLPPYKREVNTVFQKYALFPHLNVAENIGFGLNLKKVDKTVIAQKVERMLKMVGLEGFGKRDVTLLSGGQQHIHLPVGSKGIDLICLLNQFVGGGALSAQHGHHLVSRLIGIRDNLRYMAQAAAIRYGCAAKFLYNECHCNTLL